MNIVDRIARRAYDLAVRAGLSPYRRQWLLSPSDWDASYASGSLDFYGALREQGRYGVLVGFARAFPRKPRILDVGCGVGVLRARIPDEDVAGYVGIDPSQVAITQAQAQCFARSVFEVGERPSADAGLFDLIILNEMMCYVEDLDGLLENLKGHLAPGGWILTSMFHHAGDVALHRAVARHFTEVDVLEVVRANFKPLHTWRVGCYALGDLDAPGIREAPLEARLRVERG
jgi:2-polyprenyl-6-hydroxyphenyl methylase/3-demethylubiquinone-9 3-methyltransferase